MLYRTYHRNFDIVVSHGNVATSLHPPCRMGGLGFTRLLRTHQNEGSTFVPATVPLLFPYPAHLDARTCEHLQFHAFLPPPFFH